MARITDIQIKDADYWLSRAQEASDRAIAKGNLTDRQVQKLFTETFKQIETEIQAFYAKFGEISSSPTFKTLANGQKVISGTADKLVVTRKAAYTVTSKGTRLQALQMRLYEILKTLAVDQNNQMILGLSDICNDAYLHSMFTVYKGVGVGKHFNLLTQSTVRSLIENEVNGKNFSQRVWANRDKLADEVNQVLKTGIVQGLSNNEMSKRLSKTMDSGRGVASTLIQTEVTNTLNQATLQSYKDTGIVNDYEYVSALDKRTSDICRALDGDVFQVSDAATGLNYPPMHVRCRSTTIAHFDNSAEGLTRIARTLGGDSFVVPASMKYEEFLELAV